MSDASKRVWLFARVRWSAILAGAVVGIIVALVGGTAFEGPSVTVSNMAEADGVQFRDNGSVDIFATVDRTRVCPVRSQWFAWRWIVYNGIRVQQAVPMVSLEMPFFPDTRYLITTVSTPDAVKADPKSEWFARRSSVEECPFVPSWVMSLFGQRIFRSADIPLRQIDAGSAGMIKLPIVTGPAAASGEKP